MLDTSEVFAKVDRRIADMFIEKGGQDFVKIAKYALDLTKNTEGLMLERAMADSLRQHGRK